MASSVSVLIAGVFASGVLAQHASETEQLGSVRFPVLCSTEAQEKFHRAMALYHSFAWTRARPAFTEITQVDAQCGMAWWGLAMVAADNPFGWPLRTLNYTYSGSVYGLAALQAPLALERGRWSEAAKLELPAAPAPDDWKRFPQAESVHVFARALGAARSGDANGARGEIARLHTLHAALNDKKLAYWAEQTGIQAAIATAWALRAEGKDAETLATLRAAADGEDGAEKHVSMPGYLLPARELLGDLLLELGRPTEALREYEASMVKEPNRFRGLYGAARSAERAGERNKATAHYTKLMMLAAPSKYERAELRTARKSLGK
jgi:tetratricopeptide (TPR) repeat protein